MKTKGNRKLTAWSSLVGVLCVLGLAGAAVAQGLGTPTPGVAAAKPTAPSVEAFGTSESTVTTVGAFGFNGFSSDFEYQGDPSGYISIDSSSGTFFGVAPVDIPTGALLESISLEACDRSAVSGLELTLYRLGPGAGEDDSYALAVISTGFAETPGCDRFVANLSPAVTIDNQDYSYVAEIYDPDGSIDTKYRAVRFYWKRQISPAPETASFTDVPTDYWAFQSIEALAGSGITTGCGAGLYCPEDFVTRDQMAAFLSRALGLNWPN